MLLRFRFVQEMNQSTSQHQVSCVHARSARGGFVVPHMLYVGRSMRRCALEKEGVTMRPPPYPVSDRSVGSDVSTALLFLPTTQFLAWMQLALPCYRGTTLVVCCTVNMVCSFCVVSSAYLSTGLALSVLPAVLQSVHHPVAGANGNSTFTSTCNNEECESHNSTYQHLTIDNITIQVQAFCTTHHAPPWLSPEVASVPSVPADSHRNPQAR